MRSPLVAVACLAVAAGAALAGGKSAEPVSSVRLAKSWEAAVEEAKTLNLPIVVHNHGFYCPPCWGMHAGVMCNDKYIAFANENTVEVLALQDLDKAMAKTDPDATDRKRLEEYDCTDEKGNKVRYLCEFPGLTKDEVLALHRSKASSYNDTRGIPFTAVIDPHTEKEMQRWEGGGHSPKSIMEGVAAQRKVLNAAHGAGVSRAVLAKVTNETRRILEGVAKDGVAKSMTDYRALEKSVAGESETLRKKLEPVLESLIEAATKQLDDAEAKLSAGDAAGAKKILDKLGRSLKGTSLEQRANDLVAKLKG